MEDTPGNVQPDLKPRQGQGSARHTPRWTLLFVRDDGRTVPVKRFRGWLYLVAGVLLLALGTAGGLYWINRQTLAENHRLSAEAGRLREEISALRYDKDVLTTRLVLTEAQLKKLKPPEKPKPDKSTPQEKAGADPDRNDGAASGPQAEAKAAPEAPLARAEEPAVSEASPPTEIPVSEAESVSGPVSVDTLAVSHEQAHSLFRVTFNLRKDDSRQDSISGYAFVVLKPEDALEAGDWIPMPWASIESGRPSPVQRGQYFSIARFKPMKFEIKGISDPDRLGQLTIFIFDTGGKLILEQDFQLTEAAADSGDST
jgi:hypothetical protein